MKIGINSMVWKAPLTNDDLYLVQRAKDMGYDVFEVVIGREPPRFDVGLMRRALDEAGIGRTLCGGLSDDMDITSADPAVRNKGIDFLKLGVDTAVAIGARVWLGALSSAIGRRGTMSADERARQWECSVESLRKVAPYADKAGVRLAVEVLNRWENNFLNTSEEAIRLVDEVGSPAVGILADTYHFNIEEVDIAQAIRDCGHRVYAFHSCENNRSAPGHGHIPWEAVRQALLDIKYDGPIVIESFDPQNDVLSNRFAMWRPLAPDQDTLAREGLAFLRKVFG
ncbi:MAG: sugar phosphate isomerase/epimerase [Dehalococcoidales bacterium]|nr:sugar phosphate isomerase/epimerase [Dehalococcoidales bacterium]